jgi:phage/plasmid-associated DNA primase
MVNVDADILPTFVLDNTGPIKKLTGGDFIPAEYKHNPSTLAQWHLNFESLFVIANTIDIPPKLH